MSQDVLFTHFHPVPCGISEIIDTQEALEASANKEDDSVSCRDDGTSSEDAVSRRDDGTSSEDGTSRRDDGASSDDDSDYCPAVTDD